MLRTLSRHMRQNAVAWLALFVALGGTGAYAANTITSADIVDGQVKSADVANQDLTGGDIKDGSLTTFDLADGAGVAGTDIINHDITSTDIKGDSLTGTDINESTLNLAAEPWHEVGSAGQPTFNPGDGSLPGVNPGSFCNWTNYGTGHNSAGFLRDRSGFVHVKGLTKAIDGTQIPCGLSPLQTHVFTLPAGYRPAAREVLAGLSNNALQRINVETPCARPLAAGVCGGGYSAGDVARERRAGSARSVGA